MAKAGSFWTPGAKSSINLERILGLRKGESGPQRNGGQFKRQNKPPQVLFQNSG